MPDYRVKWTDKALSDLMARVHAYPSLAQAARGLGMDKGNVGMLMKRAEAKGLIPKYSDERESKLKFELAKTKNELSKLIAIRESATAIREEIYGLSKMSPEPPKWVTKGADGISRAGIPFAFWSDWHYGEVVKKSETGGMNFYNRNVAQLRIARLVENTIRLAKGFSFKETKDKPPGIVCAIGGDMLSGDIHEELAETNFAPMFVQSQEVLDLLVGGILELKKHFGKVFVPCVVGNHGRTTRKPRAKHRVYMSYEWNLYVMLERYFANDPDVSIYVPGETDAFFRVAGKRFLLTHGDALGVKGGDGIIGALGPIARGSVKMRGSEFKIGREFDYLIMGHWHQEIWLPSTFVNNALKGYDEYARLFLRAEPSRPSQMLWFVHPEHGVTARLTVYVDEGIPATKQKKWVEV